MTIKRIAQLISQWLALDDDLLLISILAAIVANRLPGDPLWLMIVGPPSTAKTELLLLPKSLPDIYVLGDLTPNTFFSGYKTSEGQPYSLLLQLLGKSVIHKDFTSVLSMPQEKRTQILGQLREIYDGDWRKNFGNKLKQDQFEGKMGFLTGCTPAIDLHYRANAQLGERFVYLRHDLVGDELRRQGARLAVRTDSEHTNLCKVTRGAIEEFMKELPVSYPTCSEEFQERLIDLAEAVAWGRCPVARDGYNRNIMQLPRPEGPGRVAKQLAAMARAHAALFRKKAVQEEDLRIVRRLAEDSLPPLRKKLLWMYAKAGHDGAQIKDIAMKIQLPYATVREHTEDALVVGLLEDIGEQKRLSPRGQTLLTTFHGKKRREEAR